MYRADTIVACATPPGRGGVAVVRCSGPGSRAIAAGTFRAAGGGLEPRMMTLGTVHSARDGSPIDQALAVFFPGPNSYTGEDVLEFHTHGSPAVVEQVIAAAIAAGARAAERGEFTRRAVLNGKLDLVQAEAVLDLVDARLPAGARAAWQHLQGALSVELASIRAMLVGLLAGLEADVDFTDDDLPEPDDEQRTLVLGEVRGRIDALRSGYAAARRQREGVRVAFVGRPNAGKSSLVNRLLGSERMIVSPEAGTTRDVVEESVDLEGGSIVLVDTAGVRRDTGLAEGIAVERARAAFEEADLRVLVLDAGRPLVAEDWDLRGQMSADNGVVVLNKCDLGVSVGQAEQQRLAAGGVAVLVASAATGEGCAELGLALGAFAERESELPPASISRLRHRSALEAASGMLQQAEALLRSHGPAELVVLEVRAAIDALAAITHPLGNEEVLDRIFAEFCLGK